MSDEQPKRPYSRRRLPKKRAKARAKKASKRPQPKQVKKRAGKPVAKSAPAPVVTTAVELVEPQQQTNKLSTALTLVTPSLPALKPKTLQLLHPTALPAVPYSNRPTLPSVAGGFFASSPALLPKPTAKVKRFVASPDAVDVTPKELTPLATAQRQSGFLSSLLKAVKEKAASYKPSFKRFSDQHKDELHDGVAQILGPLGPFYKLGHELHRDYADHADQAVDTLTDRAARVRAYGVGLESRAKKVFFFIKEPLRQIRQIGEEAVKKGSLWQRAKGLAAGLLGRRFGGLGNKVGLPLPALPAPTLPALPTPASAVASLGGLIPKPTAAAVPALSTAAKELLPSSVAALGSVAVGGTALYSASSLLNSAEAKPSEALPAEAQEGAVPEALPEPALKVAANLPSVEHSFEHAPPTPLPLPQLQSPQSLDGLKNAVQKEATASQQKALEPITKDLASSLAASNALPKPSDDVQKRVDEAYSTITTSMPDVESSWLGSLKTSVTARAKTLLGGTKTFTPVADAGSADGDKPEKLTAALENPKALDTTYGAASTSGSSNEAELPPTELEAAGKKATRINKADMSGVQPVVARRFYSMVGEFNQLTGKKVQVNSAYRDSQKQAQLYASMPKGKAARPGLSMHEFGYALDINSAEANQMASMGLMQKYGFVRNVKGEPWHLEYGPIQGMKAQIRAGAKVATPEPSVEKNPATANSSEDSSSGQQGETEGLTSRAAEQQADKVMLAANQKQQAPTTSEPALAPVPVPAQAVAAEQPSRRLPELPGDSAPQIHVPLDTGSPSGFYSRSGLPSDVLPDLLGNAAERAWKPGGDAVAAIVTSQQRSADAYKEQTYDPPVGYGSDDSLTGFARLLGDAAGAVQDSWVFAANPEALIDTVANRAVSVSDRLQAGVAGVKADGENFSDGFQVDLYKVLPSVSRRVERTVQQQEVAAPVPLPSPTPDGGQTTINNVPLVVGDMAFLHLNLGVGGR